MSKVVVNVMSSTAAYRRQLEAHKLSRDAKLETSGLSSAWRAMYEAALLVQMSYDEVEIEDMDWSDELQAFTYSCPCGDLFSISMAELVAGESIARCPSCSLYIEVVYELQQLQELSSKTVSSPVGRAITA